MGEKIKVSREVAEALDILTEFKSNESILDIHVKCKWSIKRNRCLNDFSILELAEILLNGYEVDESPEELVAETYLEKRKLSGTVLINKWENDAYANGIMFTLETLGIKIKGVNDCC